jgi:hypothetical protein
VNGGSCSVLHTPGRLVALLLAAGSACSNTTSTPSSDKVATKDDLESACAALCARRARCNTNGATSGDAGIACIPDCLDGFDGPTGSVRSDIVRGLARCYTELACGMNDDRCTADALTFAGESVDAAIHSPDVEKCLSRYQECKGTPGSFTDDDCGLLPLLVAERRQALAKCFDGACESVAPCVHGADGT